MSNSDLSKSVHQKLMNKAKDEGRPFNELLQYYAMERFLYRLSISRYSDKFILKGALMFFLWDVPGMTARPTRDIDLLGIIDNDSDSIKRVFVEICNISVDDDGVEFNSDDINITPITEEADYRGLRIRINGNLGDLGNRGYETKRIKKETASANNKAPDLIRGLMHSGMDEILTVFIDTVLQWVA